MFVGRGSVRAAASPLEEPGARVYARERASDAKVAAYEVHLGPLQARQLSSPHASTDSQHREGFETVRAQCTVARSLRASFGGEGAHLLGEPEEAAQLVADQSRIT